MAKKNAIAKVESEQLQTTNHIENLIVDVRAKVSRSKVLQSAWFLTAGKPTVRLSKSPKHNSANSNRQAPGAKTSGASFTNSYLTAFERLFHTKL